MVPPPSRGFQLVGLGNNPYAYESGAGGTRHRPQLGRMCCRCFWEQPGFLGAGLEGGSTAPWWRGVSSKLR